MDHLIILFRGLDPIPLLSMIWKFLSAESSTWVHLCAPRSISCLIYNTIDSSSEDRVHIVYARNHPSTPILTCQRTRQQLWNPGIHLETSLTDTELLRETKREFEMYPNNEQSSTVLFHYIEQSSTPLQPIDSTQYEDEREMMAYCIMTSIVVIIDDREHDSPGHPDPAPTTSPAHPTHAIKL